MSGYGDFAEFYDRLTDNVDYREIAHYYDRLIKRFGGKSGGILLDLACGTGSLSVLFKELGYDVVGVDASDEMLSKAMEKPHDGIQYVKGTMQELVLYGCCDVTVCSLDSINHLESCVEIEQTFKRVNMFTETGGLFLFDFNTPYKHEFVLGNEAFLFDLEGLFCAWQNEFEGGADCRVNMYLDFFSENNGRYDRFSDFLSEISYKTEQIKQMLSDSGFEILAVFDYLTENQPSRDSEKLAFVCKKVKEKQNG